MENMPDTNKEGIPMASAFFTPNHSLNIDSNVMRHGFVFGNPTRKMEAHKAMWNNDLGYGANYFTTSGFVGSLVPFTHVMHLAAQAGVRYAMENPGSYVHSNIASFVNLLEVCKAVDPQPAIVWASSSSVYGLNTKVPFSEKDRTDQTAIL
ncbi:hypothetical protein TSUD_412600 [Trifolium subterraneum]|uniref:NAD(P)-binding domain-containing protein n=1 Tax=Trifolium subterraneum TaxID=3900 RepID=A0A2Z6PKE1_TRISU|nr:hypothetical protein TSUD_412600 [Trifolium subterraneum]